MSAASPDGSDDLVLSIRNVHALPGAEAGELALEIETTHGTIPGVLHPCEGKSGCAIFIGGAAGGAAGGGDGPAGGVYLRLGRELVAEGVTSLRVGYRDPGEFNECVLDTLAACSFLKGIGAERAVIVGHSFGGAVAIKAGGLAPPRHRRRRALLAALRHRRGRLTRQAAAARTRLGRQRAAAAGLRGYLRAGGGAQAPRDS